MKPVFHIVALSGISILMLPWSIQISLEWLMFLNHFSKRFMLTCSVEVLYFPQKARLYMNTLILHDTKLFEIQSPTRKSFKSYVSTKKNRVCRDKQIPIIFRLINKDWYQTQTNYYQIYEQRCISDLITNYISIKDEVNIDQCCYHRNKCWHLFHISSWKSRKQSQGEKDNIPTSRYEIKTRKSKPKEGERKRNLISTRR